MFGLLVLCAFALVRGPAQAQTTANRPYYATPSWDQKLQCDTLATCPRFIVLANWNNEAVLDRETGLVWERSPLGPCLDPVFCIGVTPGTKVWLDAGSFCANKNVGGRKGWRLPSINELASLIDPSASNPTLPAGHPFTGVQSSFYWSATTVAGTASSAWTVFLLNGRVDTDDKTSVGNFVWCARGGGVLDNY